MRISAASTLTMTIAGPTAIVGMYLILSSSSTVTITLAFLITVAVTATVASQRHAPYLQALYASNVTICC